MINEAVFALQEGLASAADIDEAMKLGCSHPIGPLALADLIGLDVMLAVMEVLHRDFNDPKYRPALAAEGNGRLGSTGTQDRSRVLHVRVSRRAERNGSSRRG
jgi:3-hydroxyacyl-CoA dehydrogenase